MEIRIDAKNFDDIVEYIRVAKEMDSRGLILKSGRDFQRYPKHKSIQNSGMRLTEKHITKAEALVSSGSWRALTWTDTLILLERVG